VDFDRILITDRLAMEIFHAADREKLLFTRTPDHPLPRFRRTNVTQRALSFLVLFDQVLIHDLTDESTYRLPDLEKEGIGRLWRGTAG
jgi:hypothetical protein